VAILNLKGFLFFYLSAVVPCWYISWHCNDADRSDLNSDVKKEKYSYVSMRILYYFVV